MSPKYLLSWGIGTPPNIVHGSSILPEFTVQTRFGSSVLAQFTVVTMTNRHTGMLDLHYLTYTQTHWHTHSATSAATGHVYSMH